jgi:hypothetical protein
VVVVVGVPEVVVAGRVLVVVANGIDVTIRSTESSAIARVSGTQSLLATSQPSPDASTRSTPMERVSAAAMRPG